MRINHSLRSRLLRSRPPRTQIDHLLGLKARAKNPGRLNCTATLIESGTAPRETRLYFARWEETLVVHSQRSKCSERCSIDAATLREGSPVRFDLWKTSESLCLRATRGGTGSGSAFAVQEEVGR